MWIDMWIDTYVDRYVDRCDMWIDTQSNITNMSMISGHAAMSRRFYFSTYNMCFISWFFVKESDDAEEIEILAPLIKCLKKELLQELTDIKQLGYVRKNAQVVTNLQQTCSNAVPTTCQQDVFALLVPSLLTSCQRLVDNLLQVVELNRLVTSCFNNLLSS